MPREMNYYTIELKNASIAGCRARDVRLNGQPLTSIRALMPGHLQFAAESTRHAGGRVFGGLIGRQVEFNIGEAEKPGEQRTIRGKVSAADPAPAAANGKPTEQITIVVERILVSYPT
jgi:hypothetical protein